MHPGRTFNSWLILLLVLVLSCSGFAESAEKRIQLRTETIVTRGSPGEMALPASASSLSGLYLIQFTDRVNSAWREELRLMNVHLLRYVPDDSFIARMDSVSVSRLKSLPFVHWVGPYRPDHKIHPRLRSSMTNLTLQVRILLAPNLSSNELASARMAIGKIEHESISSFGSIVQATLTPAQLSALAASPSVLWIERAPKIKLFDEVASKIVGGNDLFTGTPTLTQQLGYDGRGVAVAVADSGLNDGTAQNMHPDLKGRVDAFFQYGTLTDAADFHSHGTHVAGIIAANGATGEKDDNGALYGIGVASGAHLIAQRIFDGVGNYEAPPSYEVLTHDAVRAGAVIGSNSWGDDVQGEYDLSAAEFDALVRDADAQRPGDQPYILEFSAGNAGPGEQTIDTPAVAKNVIATGASQNDRPDFFIYADGIDAMADFSSRGPCADGRIKPDLVAPGTWIASTRSIFADDNNAWAPISDNYMYQGGTSQAGPHASGAAAVFVQYYRATHVGATPSPAMVKAALINSAVDMDDASGTGPIPNNDEGWGRIDLTGIIGSSRGYDYVDQSVLLTNGAVYERRIVVASSDEPVKITLTYTDVPGFPGAIPALVNDLDLEVVGPNGEVYRGNQFNGSGESVANPPGRDNINNVEAVHLFTPSPGEYIVRVRARNVVEDSRRDTAQVDQDFALVISGSLPLPGQGILFFDRAAYKAPDSIAIKLIDYDLAGRSSVNISLTSTTEPAGESIVLTASGTTGLFTNTVSTATGSPVADGRLQVAHGDVITASYQDASPPGTRTAVAHADLVPPAISAVSTTNDLGKVVITWRTDEPASSIVRYGTNSALSFTQSDPELVTDHRVEIANLIVGRTYQFLVASLDEATNASTNNNGGALYSIVPAPAAAVLLVDSYYYDTSLESDPPIPLSAYTIPLDQIGVSYNVWSVGSRGLPRTADLAPFKAVIWRVNDSVWSSGSVTNNITSASVSVLTNYLNNGGTFFMSSMEILSRISDSGSGGSSAGAFFRTNYLKIQSFNEDVEVEGANGVNSDPVTSGLFLPLDYSAYPDLSQYGLANSADLSDTLNLTSEGAPIFFDSVSNKIAGVRYPKIGQDSPNRVVFLPFPLDTVSMSGAAPNNRTTLLRRALNFLLPGLNGLGTIALDSDFYSIPSVVTVEVGDSDLAGQGQTSVRFFSPLEPAGKTIVLNETPRPGLFRGTVFLTASNAPVRSGELRVRNHDQIRAEYSDASSGQTVQASALIDTDPPVISNILAEPEYSEALVSWDTSEAADALVEFGESTFLGRTAYSADLDFYHEVNVSGLLPDRIYYYRVISRDAAGNAQVDDNGGNLYTFRTLKPIDLPWFDNMEHSLTNWAVLDGDGTEVSWQLGPPRNGRETAAHSPTNCWGANLNGQNIDQAETFLVGPAFNLTGGNYATLKFWDSYDFPDLDGDIGEIAQVYISTNSGQGWVLLADFSGDTSAGWQEEEIDLTPYLGSVARIGFYYEVLSFEFHPRPAWLIDDVSIQVTNVVLGKIQVTNNLAQAQFSLSGPFATAGSGWLTLITNAPLGQYVVTWSPVPFYQTPPPQTNSVTSTNTISFSGVYTIHDVNTNGISDEWEQQFFGSVSTTRSRSTDTDGDGMSDYSEFVAGTNPNDAASRLQISMIRTNGSYRVNWTTVPNHGYQLQGSTNAVTWSPLFPWFIAGGTNSSFDLPPPAPGAPYLFRLQVKP